MNTPSRTDRRTVGVIGGKGMLGSDLARYFADQAVVTAIDRDNYKACVGQKFDLLINANGNSKRFWAIEHPLEDFRASTASVYQSLLDFSYGTYVYISTADVYENFHGPETTHEDDATVTAKLSHYGLHKFLSERIIRQHVQRFLILRSCMILGTNLRKGPVYDLLHDTPLFVTPDSRFQMITSHEIARVIDRLTTLKRSLNDVYNIGGRGSILFQRVCELLKLSFKVSPDASKQEYEMNVAKLHDAVSLRKTEEYLLDYLQQQSILPL